MSECNYLGSLCIIICCDRVIDLYGNLCLSNIFGSIGINSEMFESGEITAVRHIHSADSISANKCK
jgi:hypothetical protein